MVIQLLDNLFYVFTMAKMYKTRPCFTFLPRDMRQELEQLFKCCIYYKMSNI